MASLSIIKRVLLLFIGVVSAGATARTESTIAPEKIASPATQIIKQKERTIQIDAWGNDGIRVRITPPGWGARNDIPNALVSKFAPIPSSFNLKAGAADKTGLVTFTRASDNKVILRETGWSDAAAGATRRVRAHVGLVHRRPG